MHADVWIRTAKLAFFVALGFVRFVGKSTSLQPLVTLAVERLRGAASDYTAQGHDPK
jgi:hypothetical protein